MSFKESFHQGLVEGLVKQAFTEEEARSVADEIVTEYDNIEKLASAFMPGTFYKGLNEGAGKALGGVGTAALVGAGLLGISKLYKNTVNEPIAHTKFMRAVDQAIAKNQVLQHADKAKVVAIAESIFKYAPNAGADANLLSSILSNAVMMDGIDPQVVQSLVNLEKTYMESRKTNIAGMLAKG